MLTHLSLGDCVSMGTTSSSYGAYRIVVFAPLICHRGLLNAVQQLLCFFLREIPLCGERYDFTVRCGSGQGSPGIKIAQRCNLFSFFAIVC